MFTTKARYRTTLRSRPSRQQSDKARDLPLTVAGKVRLLSLESLDGRTAAVQRAHQLISNLEREIGSDELSTAKRELVKRAALTGALCEDIEARWISGAQVNLADYASLTNVQRRLLACIGLEHHRSMRDITADADDPTFVPASGTKSP